MNKASTSKTPPKGAELADMLIKTAREMVERDGVEMVSLRGVAKAVGVSQAAPYHYFKDKRSLLAAIAADGFREKAAMMRRYAEDAHNPRDRLNRIGQCYVQFAAKHPSLFLLMQGPLFHSDSTDEELRAARNESQMILQETVAACLPGANARQIMSACAGAWAIVHGVAILYIDGRLGRLIDVDDVEEVSKIITGRLAIERFLEI